MDKEQIKELRNKLGMSQDRFAALVGVAPMTIRRWERGTKPNQLGDKRLCEIKIENSGGGKS
jgi:DNA-binding transcriptional regulator YiaG